MKEATIQQSFDSAPSTLQSMDSAPNTRQSVWTDSSDTAVSSPADMPSSRDFDRVDASAPLITKQRVDILPQDAATSTSPISHNSSTAVSPQNQDETESDTASDVDRAEKLPSLVTNSSTDSEAVRLLIPSQLQEASEVFVLNQPQTNGGVSSEGNQELEKETANGYVQTSLEEHAETKLYVDSEQRLQPTDYNKSSNFQALPTSNSPTSSVEALSASSKLLVENDDSRSETLNGMFNYNCLYVFFSRF